MRDHVLEIASNPVIDAYSRCTDEYDAPENLDSCWGKASERLWTRITPQPRHRLIADVGCGTGRTLAHVAERCPSATTLAGVEPAARMRERAQSRMHGCSNVVVFDGRFEALPFANETVDYLYSIMAFHWVTDPRKAAQEIARVLSPHGELDLFFIGRWNGREFIRATTPVFLRHMGPARLLAAAKLRQQLTAAEALDIFQAALPGRGVDVQESYDTWYDTLDGHLAWWVRLEGQLVGLTEDKRRQSDRDTRAALQALETPRGIPYTMHLLHVTLRG